MLSRIKDTSDWALDLVGWTHDCDSFSDSVGHFVVLVMVLLCLMIVLYANSIWMVDWRCGMWLMDGWRRNICIGTCSLKSFPRPLECDAGGFARTRSGASWWQIKRREWQRDENCLFSSLSLFLVFLLTSGSAVDEWSGGSEIIHHHSRRQTHLRRVSSICVLLFWRKTTVRDNENMVNAWKTTNSVP